MPARSRIWASRSRMSARLYAVGVGPQKTGSTWLDRVLRAHPALCSPRDVKETFFLDRRYGRGWGWYWSCFPDDCPGERFVEVGPTYFHREEVPARVRANNPECRIVVTLRDPAERTFSLYVHHRRKGRRIGSLKEALESVPALREGSRYSVHLPRWFKAFGRKRVHVLLLDDVAERPDAVLDELWPFLGVDRIKAPDQARERVYGASYPRWPGLAGLATRVAGKLREVGAHRWVEVVKRLGGRLVYTGGEDRMPSLTPSVRGDLVRLFSKDIDYVERLLDRDLSSWRGGTPCGDGDPSCPDHDD